MEFQSQMSNQHHSHKRVHQLGEDLLHEPKAWNTFYVSDVIANNDRNWRTMEEVLAKRAKQINHDQRAANKYRTVNRDICHWLDNMEHKVSQLEPVSSDAATMTTQVEQIKKLNTEVMAFKPKIIDVNNTGHILDHLIEEGDCMVSLSPHYRSLQLSFLSADQLAQQCQRVDAAELGDYQEEDSKINSELAKINERYEALCANLTDHDEVLDLSSQLAEKNKDVGKLMECITVTDAKVISAAPCSGNVGHLSVDLDNYKDSTEKENTKLERRDEKCLEMSMIITQQSLQQDEHEQKSASKLGQELDAKSLEDIRKQIRAEEAERLRISWEKLEKQKQELQEMQEQHQMRKMEMLHGEQAELNLDRSQCNYPQKSKLHRRIIDTTSIVTSSDADELDGIEDMSIGVERSRKGKRKTSVTSFESRASTSDCTSRYSESDSGSNDSSTSDTEDVKKFDDEVIRDVRDSSVYVTKVRKSSTSWNGHKKKSDRVYNSRHCCPYCEKMVSNFAQHVLGKQHQDEQEVVEIMSHDKQSKEIQKKRKDLLAILRNKGDNMHNVKVLHKKSGELLLSRRLNEDETSFAKEDYGPCPSCFEWLRITIIARHQHNCPARDKNSETLPKGNILMQSNIISGRISGNPSKSLTEEVLPIMKRDEIGNLARDDTLIVFMGNDYMKRNVGNKLMRKYYASAVMRLLSRLLLHLRTLARPATGIFLEDFLVPAHFADVAEAALLTCSPDERDPENLKTPSHALKLGSDLKRLASMTLVSAIKSGDEGRRRRAKDFLKLMEIEWSTKLERVLLQERKHRKKVPLPLPADIEKFATHLKDEARRADLDDHSFSNYKKVVLIAEASLIAYNRRRPGEVQALSLSDYKARHSGEDEVCPEVVGKLTQFEHYLLKTQDVIMIRGKHGKFVPLLVSADIKPLLDFVTSANVRQDAGISSSNPYVFANSGAGVIRGGHAVASVAHEAELVSPERIRATNCRRFMATMIQGLDVSPQQQKWIVDHLGHTLDVHNVYYRATSDILERTDISKILLMMDTGRIAEFKGRQIKDIQLEELMIDVTTSEDCDLEDTEGDVDTAFDLEDRAVDDHEERAGKKTSQGFFRERASGDEEDYLPDLLEQEGDDEEYIPDLLEEEDEPIYQKPKKRKMTERHKWTAHEIQEVKKLFKFYLQQDKTPGERAVSDAMKESKKKGGTIWKLKLKNIKSKVSWIRLHGKKK